MRFFRLIVFFIFFILLSGHFGHTQDFSNKGKEFYITYPAHVDGTISAMGIYITSDQAATGQVEIGTGGAVITFNIAANTVRRIFLGSASTSDAPNGSVYQDQLEGIKPGSSIKVTSNQPVVVYAHIIRSARSASSLILPSVTWGREYIIPSYSSVGASGTSSGRGVINIVAKESNTIVEINPKATSFDGLRAANVPYTITLTNPGDVYQVQFQKDADISGTLVRSVASGGTGCKPIGVFSASTWSAFNCTGASGGDNLFQQLFPIRSFGKTFITAPFANKQSDLFRVFAVEPGTIVTKTENGVSTLLAIGPNGFAEFETGLPTKIAGDKPISVVQYLTSQTCDTRNTANCFTTGNCPFPSDPEMILLNPVEQTTNNITVFSAHQNWVPQGQSNVNQCYLNIIIPTPAANSLRINNAAPANSFVPIPGTNYSYLQENVSTLALGNPIQQIIADSNFSCIAYGYGNVESYGYNAGTKVKDLLQFLTIRDPNLTQDAPSVCQQTPSKLYVTLPYLATKLEWKFNGLFPDVVINAPVADSIYQKEGKTVYRFPLQGFYLFPTTGTSPVSIIATNPTLDGCTGEQQIDFEIFVHPKPMADFTYTYTGCISDSARFTSTGTITGTESLVKWDWSFGDNTTGSGKTIAHKYLTSGSREVAHRVTSKIGCVSDNMKKTLTVNAKPIAAFVLTGPFCQNRPLNIANTSNTTAGSITKWYWDMGNGQIFDKADGAPFNYTYAAIGTYTVKHVVTTSAGCTGDTLRQTITVGYVPVPSFILPEVCLNDAFAEFTNSTTIAGGNLSQISWNWNFGNPAAGPGNPNTSTILNGRHRYSSSGTYQVKLVATTALGCADSTTQTLTVNGDKPLAAFDVVTQGNFCSNLPVQIRNKSTVNFGKITRLIIFWNAGANVNDTTDDNDPLLDKVYTKKYTEFSSPAVRQIQVRLRAYSGGICVNDITKTIDLYATPAPRIRTIPGICLDATPRLITQGFDAGSNTGQGFYSGAGITAAGLFDPKITGAGTFSIGYRYLTAAGCTDSTTGSVLVWPQPTAAFGVSSPSCINSPITLTNQSIANANTIIAWRWDYGNGISETRTNGNPFTRTYITATDVNITLRVSTDSGCNSNLLSKTVAIYPTPNVDFNLPTLVCMPSGRAAFTNKTVVGGTGGTPIGYVWNFGVAGGNSTDVNPVFNYAAAGTYTIRLRATSARGCSDSAIQTLQNVYPQPLANWSANPGQVCLGTAIQFTDQSNPLNTTITSWQWNFGDGTTSNLQNTSRIFTTAGVFKVTMSYNTNIGCPSDTLSKSVTVHPFPVVDAGPDQFVLQGGQAILRGSATGSGNYTYLWAPPTWLSNPNILQPLTKAEGDITYKLTVTGDGGCASSDEVFVKSLLKPEIFNAFSPNGDGINDTWIIRYLDTYPGAIVQVFDRYGKSILKSTGYNKAWDGTISGSPIPAGVYYYIVDPKNGLKPMTGSVTIIR
jgi:gliding motility-associated-like protein